MWLFPLSEVSATNAFFILRHPAGQLNYTISRLFRGETAADGLRCQTNDLLVLRSIFVAEVEILHGINQILPNHRISNVFPAVLARLEWKSTPLITPHFHTLMTKSPYWGN